MYDGQTEEKRSMYWLCRVHWNRRITYQRRKELWLWVRTGNVEGRIAERVEKDREDKTTRRHVNARPIATTCEQGCVGSATGLRATTLYCPRTVWNLHHLSGRVSLSAAGENGRGFLLHFFFQNHGTSVTRPRWNRRLLKTILIYPLFTTVTVVIISRHVIAVRRKYGERYNNTSKTINKKKKKN